MLTRLKLYILWADVIPCKIYYDIDKFMLDFEHASWFRMSWQYIYFFILSQRHSVITHNVWYNKVLHLAVVIMKVDCRSQINIHFSSQQSRSGRGWVGGLLWVCCIDTTLFFDRNIYRLPCIKWFIMVWVLCIQLSVSSEESPWWWRAIGTHLFPTSSWMIRRPRYNSVHVVRSRFNKGNIMKNSKVK